MTSGQKLSRRIALSLAEQRRPHRASCHRCRPTVAAVAAADTADARNNTAPRVADALRRCLKVTNKRPKDAGRHAAGQTLLQTSQTTTPQVPPDQVCHRERQTLTIGMDIDSHSEEVDAAAAYLIPMGLPDATARIHAYCLRRR